MTDYYVDGDVGADINAGTSEGSGNAWATIDKACQTMVAGDRTYVKASVSYDESATFANVGTGRTAATMIQLIGYTTTPGDNGIVQMQSTAGNNCLTDPVATHSYYRIHNFDFFGSLDTNVDLNSTIEFQNCRFRNAVNEGGVVGSGCQFYNCLFQNNGQQGIATTNDATYVACTFVGSAYLDPWVTNNANPRYYKCLFTPHSYGGGANVFVTFSMEVMIACTIDGRAGAGGREVDDICGAVAAERMFCDNLIVGCDSRVLAQSTAAAGTSFGAYGNVVGDLNVVGVDGLFCTTSEGAGVDILGLSPSATIGTFAEAEVDDIFEERYVNYLPAAGSAIIGSGVKPPDTV